MQNGLQENGVDHEDMPADQQYANAEDVFYSDLGDDLYRKTLPLLNDVLGKLLAISISLSGGTAFFLGDKQYPFWMKVSAATMFLLAFILSIIGIVPRTASVALRCPEEIKRSVDEAISWKSTLVCGAATFIILGIILAVVGFFVKGT